MFQLSHNGHWQLNHFQLGHTHLSKVVLYLTQTQLNIPPSWIPSWLTFTSLKSQSHTTGVQTLSWICCVHALLHIHLLPCPRTPPSNPSVDQEVYWRTRTRSCVCTRRTIHPFFNESTLFQWGRLLLEEVETLFVKLRVELTLHPPTMDRPMQSTLSIDEKHIVHFYPGHKLHRSQEAFSFSV